MGRRPTTHPIAPKKKAPKKTKSSSVAQKQFKGAGAGQKAVSEKKTGKKVTKEKKPSAAVLKQAKTFFGEKPLKKAENKGIGRTFIQGEN